MQTEQDYWSKTVPEPVTLDSGIKTTENQTIIFAKPGDFIEFNKADNYETTNKRSYSTCDYTSYRQQYN